MQHDHTAPEEWVIWNSTSGLLATAALGRIEQDASGARSAWMALPFDMLGPFSLDELEAQGRVAFAACLVMSRQRWQLDQVALRQAAYEQRRAAQERQQQEQAQFHGAHGFHGFHDSHRRHRPHRPSDERAHREALNLPTDGQLQPAQIKTAYRRLAQKAHPDMGGSHDLFVRLTEARNALLGRVA